MIRLQMNAILFLTRQKICFFAQNFDTVMGHVTHHVCNDHVLTCLVFGNAPVPYMG